MTQNGHDGRPDASLAAAIDVAARLGLLTPGTRAAAQERLRSLGTEGGDAQALAAIAQLPLPLCEGLLQLVGVLPSQAPAAQTPAPRVADTLRPRPQGDLPQADAPTVQRESASLPAPRPNVPRRLGPYELIGELGHGGMGIVFRARHVALGNDCAVKVLIAGEHASPEAIARFQREAAAVAKMGKHANLVSVHDLGQEGSLTYYAMELVEGETLRRRLTERPPTPREAAALVEKVARALHFAHEHGVIHRDVKPENLVVRADGEPQVMDFGLARDIGSDARLSVTGQIMGTPAYMAPEQARGELSATDARTDVYGLGAVFYEALTGIPPHGGQDLEAVFGKILRGDLVPPRRLRAEVPKDLETVCMKCLETDPERRYATAEALAEDLARWQRGEPVEARPVSWVSRLWRKAVRRRAVVVPTAAALSLGIAMLAWAGAGAWRNARQVRAWTHDARALETKAGAQTDLTARTEGYRQARDLWVRVINQDPANGEALAGRGRSDERIAQTQGEAEAERTREALRKGARMRRALLRFSKLSDSVLWPMESVFYDDQVPLAEKQSRNEAGWKEVERYMEATPEDPASQATMWACAGWARRLAGHEEEGLAWIRKAEALDSEVPSGPLLRALVLFTKYVDRQPLPSIVTGIGFGVEFGSAPGETSEMKRDREEMERALVEAEKRLIHGEEGAEVYRAALSGMRAMQRGDYEEAERRLTDAMEEPELRPARMGLGLARGKVRYLRQAFEGALSDLEESRRVRGGQATTWVCEGLIWEGKGDVESTRGVDPRPSHEKAIADYGEALKRNPEYAEAYNNRGVAFLSLGEAEGARGVDPRASYQKAIADLGAALMCSPESAEAYNGRGIAFLRLGEAEGAQGVDPRGSYTKAIADCGEALKRNPEYTEAYNNRGGAFRSLGDAERARGADPRASYQRAIADYGAALKRNPGFAEAYNGRGGTFLSLGEAEGARGVDPRASYQKAIADHEQALKRNPEDAVAYISRGMAFCRLAEAEGARGVDPRASYQKAIADHVEALKRNPESADAYNTRGNAFRSLGEAEGARGVDPRASYQKAIADYGEALKRNPRCALAYNGRGIAFLHLGEAEGTRGVDPRASYQKAIADCEEALKRNPEFAEAYSNRGGAFLKLGQGEGARGVDPRASYQKAIADCGEALKRNVEQAPAHIIRGIAFKSLGEAEGARGVDPRASYQKAIDDYDAALERDPKSWQAHANKGLLLEAMGEPARAVECYEKALALVRDNYPPLTEMLARARQAARSDNLSAWARKLREADRTIRRGDYAAARSLYEEALSQAPAQPDASSRALLQDAHYNLACIYALLSAGKDSPTAEPRELDADDVARHRERAFRELRGAIDLGYADAKHLSEDSDLAPLHDDPRWSELLGRLKK